jgi:hypothetical protein
MSNIGHSSPTEDDLAARRHDDLGHDLELLVERLAESREAIVRLLAARSGDDETLAAEEPGDEETVAEKAWRDDEAVAEEVWQDNETEYTEPAPVGSLRPLRRPIAPLDAEVPRPPEPEVSPPQVVAGEPYEPELEGDVEPYQLPSSLRRPGPPALELALIYREIARNEPPRTVPAAGAPGAVPVVKIPVLPKAPAPLKPVRVKASDKAQRAMNRPLTSRRRLLAVVLTAVGAVVLLTTIVSVLPSVLSAL